MIATSQLYRSVSKNQLVALFVVAFIVRSLTFYGYIRDQEFYKQADSVDYHNSAICMSYGYGMYRPDTGEPTFWRTPGYPLYLVPFYKMYPTKSFAFSDAAAAQQASIWFQIFLCSFIPILLLYLALALTQTLLIAYITAWISVFHLGLILTSTYLLTEGISLIPFYLFLLYFYRSFKGLFQNGRVNYWPKQILLAALMLAIYTWMRPMGQYVAVVSALILLLFSSGIWKLKRKKIALFMLTFLVLISPWFIRNHQLTGRWFFCPMFGTYLNSFCAPRIVSTVNNMDLIDAWKQLGGAAEMRYRQLKPAHQRIGMHLPKEYVCGEIAWPIFLGHPLLAAYDWMREVVKTTFDLYSSQLVAFVQGCYFYDPIIEYLSEKVQHCLYKTPMPLSMRFIVYLELIYALVLWTGLLGGFWVYMLMPCMHRFNIGKDIKQQFALWMMITPMIAAVVFMTGGFGYARLRLPIEPLMIILSLTFWYWFLNNNET